MNRLPFCLILSLLLFPALSHAGEPCPLSVEQTLRCTQRAAVPCYCPDDYCRKPFPCIPCPDLPTTADCYSRKPFPCIPYCRMSFCPDDYCRKPFPQYCWPVNKQLYRCPPGNDTTSAAQGRKKN